MAKWFPAPESSPAWAQKRAEELFGEGIGIARWVRSLPKTHRFAIMVQLVEAGEATKYGVVGAGNDWPSAVAAAEKTLEAYVALQDKDTEAKAEVVEAP